MEEIEQKCKYAKSKSKKFEDKQAAKKIKCEKTELAKACKEFIHFGLDLLGLFSKKIVLAVLMPKPAPKTSEKSVNFQNKRKKTVKQYYIQFEKVLVKKKREKIIT